MLAYDRAAGEAVVVDQGSVISRASTDDGPMAGAIANDGSAWGFMIQDNEPEDALMFGYTRSLARTRPPAADSAREA